MDVNIHIDTHNTLNLGNKKKSLVKSNLLEYSIPPRRLKSCNEPIPKHSSWYEHSSWHEHSSYYELES